MNVFEILPPASPRIGFYRTVAFWKDAAMLEFGPEGTMHYAQGTIKGDTGNLYTTGMKERQIIFGDTKNLEQAIRDIDRNLNPEVLFVVSSPVSEIIGTDLNYICRKIQPQVQTNLRVWDQVPVEGTEAMGSRRAYKMAADYLPLVSQDYKQKSTDGFVVIGLGESDWNGVADLVEICRMMKDYFGITCLNDRNGRYRLRDLGKAKWILAAAPEAVPLAVAVQKLWGTPYYTGYPLGIRGCEDMLNAFEASSGIRRSENWDSDLSETRKMVSLFRQSIRSIHSRRFYVDSRRARQSDWIDFLARELELDTVFPCDKDHALSADGSLNNHAGIQDGDILIASAMLCSLYSGHPSLCVEYPIANQKQFSVYAPFIGLRGVQNLLTQIYALMLRTES